MKIKGMRITKNEKQLNGDSKTIFTTKVSFGIDMESLSNKLKDWAMEYGLRVAIQKKFRWMNSATEVHEFLKKHGGIITQDALDELDRGRPTTPRTDPRTTALNNIKAMPDGPEKEKAKAEFIEAIMEA